MSVDIGSPAVRKVSTSSHTSLTGFLSKRILKDIQYPECFVSSNFLSKRNLLVLRSICLLYQFIILITSFALYVSSDGKYWFFFTNLTYIGITTYLAVAVFNSYIHLYHRHENTLTLLSTQEALYSTISVYHIIVTIVFWMWLPPDFGGTVRVWTSVSQHGIQTAIMIMELIFSRMLLNWWGLLINITLLFLYLGWSWIYHAYSGNFMYPFLDPSHPGAPIFYPGSQLRRVPAPCVMGRATVD